MKNPCLPLAAMDSGLSIDERNGVMSIVITQALATPLVLPECGQLNIRLAKHASAHMLATSPHINLVLEQGSQAFWYGLSAPRVSFAAVVGAEARLSIASINLSREASDCAMKVELVAPGAQVNFIGLDQLAGTTVSSTRLHIVHQTKNTISTQAFRGIYGGDSQGSFEGTVSVAPHAEGSSAKQLYKSVLLSEGARAFVKPELEIDNFNIAASHGASIGQLDPEALFYLCSRGLNRVAAQAILLRGMSADIVQAIGHPAMRDFMSHQVELSMEALS